MKSGESGSIEKTADLLGGTPVIKSHVTSYLDAHDLLARGLPSRSLVLLTNSLTLGDVSGAMKALGLSVRTLQRKSGTPSARLSPEQSGRAWKFAEILSRATGILGSQTEAEQWLERPAMALEQRRPLDLLTTPAGLELVEDHLTRMEYGVYS